MKRLGMMDIFFFDVSFFIFFVKMGMMQYYGLQYFDDFDDEGFSLGVSFILKVVEVKEEEKREFSQSEGGLEVEDYIGEFFIMFNQSK